VLLLLAASRRARETVLWLEFVTDVIFNDLYFTAAGAGAFTTTSVIRLLLRLLSLMLVLVLLLLLLLLMLSRL